LQHTVEQLIEKINVMKDKALELHRLRNRYSEMSGKTYDKIACNHVLDQIQQLALEIAYDKQGDDIKTDMEEWKK
tara:strand:- start:2666 stop:2890 length:225 start_codon:yes stop_codon:yes gene_type:complete